MTARIGREDSECMCAEEVMGSLAMELPADAEESEELVPIDNSECRRFEVNHGWTWRKDHAIDLIPDLCRQKQEWEGLFRSLADIFSLIFGRICRGNSRCYGRGDSRGLRRRRETADYSGWQDFVGGRSR